MNDDLPGNVSTKHIGRFDTDQVANAVVASHNDDVMRAVETAVWHTLIDQAKHEVFVDDPKASTFRRAIRTLQDAGYALGDDTAFYAGRDAIVRMRHRLPSIEDGDTTDAEFTFDGYDVYAARQGPANIVVVVDPECLVRLPTELMRRRVGGGDTATVSSPIMVQDPDGVVVVNIDRR